MVIEQANGCVVLVRCRWRRTKADQALWASDGDEVDVYVFKNHRRDEEVSRRACVGEAKGGAIDSKRWPLDAALRCRSDRASSR